VIDKSRFWRRYGIPLLIIVACAAVDVAARILLEFNMVLVSAVEAMLFGTTAAAFVWVAERVDTEGKARRVTLTLAGFFGLGALRSGVWAGFGNVMLANMTALGAGILAVLGVWIYRRRQQSIRMASK
jgi:hypothetical protein